MDHFRLFVGKNLEQLFLNHVLHVLSLILSSLLHTYGVSYTILDTEEPGANEKSLFPCSLSIK